EKILLIPFEPHRLRRPLCSALFPYTTLFRSVEGSIPFRSTINSGVFGGPIAARIPNSSVAVRICRDAQVSRVESDRFARDLSITDRKSTRLNSSHRTISYAVFCLKK